MNAYAKRRTAKVELPQFTGDPGGEKYRLPP